MSLRPSLPVLLGAVAIVLIATFAWSLRQFARYQPYQLISMGRGPTLTFGLALQDVNMQGRHAGAMVWQLHAARIVLSQDRREASADGLTQGILYQDAQPALLFAAGHAQADLTRFGPSAGGIGLTGAVQLRTAGALSRRLGTSVSLEAPALTWNATRGTLVCPATMRAVIGSLGTVSASSLSCDIRKKTLTIGALHVVAAVGSAGVAPIAPTAPSTKQSLVHIDAPGGGSWDGQAHTWVFHGPVTFTKEDATMKTEDPVYDQRADIARTHAPVTFKDPEITLSGDQGSVDFRQHIAALNGHIHMTVIPKSSADSKDSVDKEAHEPAVMTCDQVVYNYHTKEAVATGHFTIRQKERTVTADQGSYNADQQVANLTGDVHGSTTDGQTFNAPAAVISLKPGHQTVDINGPITGDFPVNDQDNPLPKH